MRIFSYHHKGKNPCHLTILRILLHPAFLLVVCGVVLMAHRWFLKSLSSHEASQTTTDVRFLRQAPKIAVNQTQTSEERHTEKPQPRNNTDDDYDDDTVAVQREELRRNDLVKKPHRWQTFVYGDLHAYFSCALEFGKGRPLYNSTQWMRLHEYYDHFVNEDRIDEGDAKNGQLNRTFRFSDEKFVRPFEGFITESKGRGIR